MGIVIVSLIILIFLVIVKMNYIYKNKMHNFVEGNDENIIKEIANKYPNIELFEELFNDKNPTPLIKVSDIPHELKYYSDSQILKPQVHLGQRKLLISEIQFLTDVQSEFIIYAGSAPGHKNLLLAELFPDKKFILIDPNKFKINLPGRGIKPIIHRDKKHPDIIHIYHHYPTKSNIIPRELGRNRKISEYSDKEFSQLIDFIKDSSYKIFIIEDYMDNRLAERLSALDVGFISDIRSNISGSEHPKNIDLYWNSAMQYNWTHTLRPERSLFKMRLSFGVNDPEDAEIDFIQDDFKNNPFKEDYLNNRFTFPKSEMFIQAWSPVSSTEMRFLTLREDLDNFIEYDVETIENKFNYYNSINRGYIYHDNPNTIKRLHFCNCNDCALENIVLTNYVEKYTELGSVIDLVKLIDNIGRPLNKMHNNNIYENLEGEKLEKFVKNITKKSTSNRRNIRQLRGEVGKEI